MQISHDQRHKDEIKQGADQDDISDLQNCFADGLTVVFTLNNLFVVKQE